MNRIIKNFMKKTLPVFLFGLLATLGSFQVQAQSTIDECVFSEKNQESWMRVNAGDLDGDEQDDLIISIPFDDTNGYQSGRVVFFSSETLEDCDEVFNLDDADADFFGEEEDRLGTWIKITEDTDGDELREVILGTADDPEAYTILSSEILSGSVETNLLSRRDAVVSVTVAENIGCSLHKTSSAKFSRWPVFGSVFLVSALISLLRSRSNKK